LGIIPKLTLVFALFAAVLVASVGVLSYRSGRAALQAATISELLATITEKHAALDSWVEERRTGIMALAGVPGLVDDVTAFIAARGAASSNAMVPPAAQAAHDQLIQEMSARVGPDRRYLALLVIDPATGTVIAATDPRAEGTSEAGQPFFVHGKSGPYIQNPYYSPTVGGPAITAAAPLRSHDGQLLVVLAGHLKLTARN